MTTYTVTLTPTLVHSGTEGSMDTSLVSGKSIQRTMHGVLVKNSTNYKMVGKIADGGTFTDTVETITDYANID